MIQMRIVLRIGGSIIASPINPTLINKYVDLLRKMKARKHELVVVVGGGTYARDFIKAAKEIGLQENAQDRVAISVSRIFAQLFNEKLGRLGCAFVPVTVNDATECLGKSKIVVMGGLKPGTTTDTVAALVAERIGAELLVKATDQSGVYDKDPRKHSDAIKIDHMRLTDLRGVLAENKHKAGIHQIIDPEAVKILCRHPLKVIVVDGFKPENVLLAVENKHVGTVID
jgi:uridylate kinase